MAIPEWNGNRNGHKVKNSFIDKWLRNQGKCIINRYKCLNITNDKWSLL
jgi:hypothetical protein